MQFGKHATPIEMMNVPGGPHTKKRRGLLKQKALADLGAE
jgi:hypothetical protein